LLACCCYSASTTRMSRTSTTTTRHRGSCDDPPLLFRPHEPPHSLQFAFLLPCPRCPHCPHCPQTPCPSSSQLLDRASNVDTTHAGSPRSAIDAGSLLDENVEPFEKDLLCLCYVAGNRCCIRTPAGGEGMEDLLRTLGQAARVLSWSSSSENRSHSLRERFSGVNISNCPIRNHPFRPIKIRSFTPFQTPVATLNKLIQKKLLRNHYAPPRCVFEVCPFDNPSQFGRVHLTHSLSFKSLHCCI
jgi:hypothetical protein